MDIFHNAARSGVNALSALALACAITACGAHDPPAAPPVPVAEVIKVEHTAVPVTEDYAGQTEAADTVEIRARVGGLLERQTVDDGARVRKGQLLFVIDQQPYVAALDQARAMLAQAQASLVNSRENLERLQPLLADQAVSQQDMDAAVAKERSDTALVEAGAAQVRQAQLNLSYTAIVAPRDGTISKALIKPGGLVNAATTLLTTLYSTDPIYVNFAIGERRMLALQKQMHGDPGAPRDGHEAPFAFTIRLVDGSVYRHSGRLNFIDAAVDQKSDTLQMRLSVANPDHLLRPGQFVRVLLAGEQNANAILVPQKAVQEIQGVRSVLVVGSDSKVSYREINAGTRQGNDWIVEGGLAPGELVVVEGIQKLKPGTTVKPDIVAAGAPPGKPVAMTPSSTGNGG